MSISWHLERSPYKDCYTVLACGGGGGGSGGGGVCVCGGQGGGGGSGGGGLHYKDVVLPV